MQNKQWVYIDLGVKEETGSTENKEQQPPSNNPATATAVISNEKPTKRARRARNDTFSGIEANQNDTVAAEHVLRSQVSSSTVALPNQKKTGHGKVILYYITYTRLAWFVKATIRILQ